jgi:ABC-type sugar transport system ATPase subunit
MNRLEVEALTKTFPNGGRALASVGFAVSRGEFFSVVGPTNAGKSTLLKIVAGLIQPNSGRMLLDGVDMHGVKPRDRRVSLLFQNIALFPTLSGFDNIAYPLRLGGMPEVEVKRRVEEVAGIVEIGHLLGRLPRTFSGGEQQRTAIARALAYPSQLLMLDEPLTNLDARLRIKLRLQFKALHRERGQSILYVTHDQVEAMSLSDRILVLNEGRVEQIGTPDEVYHAPATRFVAEFVGTPPMNLFDADVIDGGRLALDGADLGPPACGTDAPRLPARAAIGIRPEHVRVAPAPNEAARLPGEVLWIERLGSRNVLGVRIAGRPAKAVVATDHPVQTPGPAWFGLPGERRHLLDRDSGRFIHFEGRA